MKLGTKLIDWADKTWLQEEVTHYPYGYRLGLAVCMTGTLMFLWYIA